MSRSAKGSKKIGRNEKKCVRYFAEGRRAKNRKLKNLRIAVRYAALGCLAVDRRHHAANSGYPNVAIRHGIKADRLFALAASFEARA